MSNDHDSSESLFGQTKTLTENDPTDRQFSFMGLYRKFNEADLFELMHLTKKKNSGIREIEMATLFA